VITLRQQNFKLEAQVSQLQAEHCLNSKLPKRALSALVDFARQPGEPVCSRFGD
jgi:hypothetical protein